MADESSKRESKKPVCKYGSKCYRKNPDHLLRFSHPETSASSTESGSSNPAPSDKAPPRRTQRKRRSKEEPDSFVDNTKRVKVTEEPSLVSHAGPSSTATTADHTQPTLTPASDCSSSTHPSGDDHPLNSRSIDADELERDRASVDMREKVQRKFLVEMPDDFYQFWEFCKSLDPSHPETALVSSVGLELVGPYHVLAGRLEGVAWDKCVLHHRHFYDPPEMLTVLRRESDANHFHLGYFRDDPGKTDGALIVSNDRSKGCELKVEAQNLFAAVKFEVEKAKKLHSKREAKLLQSLDEQLEQKMTELQLTATDGKTLARQRGKQVLAKCLHKIGIVVPYDKKTDVGYRSLPKTDRELVKLLDSISKCADPTKRDLLFEPLQEMVTFVQFANDECDYGMGLELGLDLFCHGDGFHGVVSHLLPLAYSLLDRPQYGSIVEKHLANRQHCPLDFSTLHT